MLNREAKEGDLRLLTPGEITMARSIFGNAIHYHKVWIHKGSYLPFGLQQQNVAMAPNGEIYFRNDYTDDFADARPNLKHLFIHEMTHVWQYQHGMNVKIRGLVSWAVNYRYKLEGRSLSRYSMEQQASIVADYYLLTLFDGRVYWEKWKKCATDCDDLSNNELLRKYKDILRYFPG